MSMEALRLFALNTPARSLAQLPPPKPLARRSCTQRSATRLARLAETLILEAGGYEQSSSAEASKQSSSLDERCATYV